MPPLLLCQYKLCNSTALALTTTLLSTDDFAQDEMTIYPVPTAGHFTISLGKMRHDISVAIASVTGQVLKAANYNDGNRIDVDIPQPAGVYFVTVTADGQKSTRAIIKK